LTTSGQHGQIKDMQLFCSTKSGKKQQLFHFLLNKDI
jgi:hypothetical protein